MDVKALTDLELAFLTYAVEAAHDSDRRTNSENIVAGYKEDVYHEDYMETAENLREQLENEYERRGLDFDKFQGVE